MTTAAPPLLFRHWRPIMANLLRKSLNHPLLAVGSTVLWGLIELVALNRHRRPGR